MPRSVSSASGAQATLAATLFDEWGRCGLRDVVLSPGSRSTPLVLAAASRADLRLHVRLDERGAGFFALGRALVTDRPVAIIVTSGTAAAELHACVAEADLAFVPLIVVTADRPLDLHGIGAPQTIDQGHLYGSMVRRFEDAGAADSSEPGSWRPLARRLWDAANGDSGPPGPVQLNAPFDEPLLGEVGKLPERSATDAPSRRAIEDAVTELDVAGRSVLCVVGRGVSADVIAECTALDWVVLGDATARGSLAYFDALLRSDNFAARYRPELVVRLGGLPASRVLADSLRAWEIPTVALSGAGFVADPDGLVSEVSKGLPWRGVERLRGRHDYAQRWKVASARVGTWLETLDATEPFCEPLVARSVVTTSGDADVPLVVGSSMPVRDVEWWAPPRRAATYANRGVSGIDGVVSTTLGVAAGSAAIGLVGDLTMLHDVSALVDGLGDAGGSCALVVVDNDGGGIFSFLPQASELESEQFERLFATPRNQDLEVVAGAFGHGAVTVVSVNELRSAIDKGLASDGVSVIVAKVPSRDANVALHQRWNDDASALVNGLVE